MIRPKAYLATCICHIGDPLRSQQGDSKIVENGGRPAEAVIPEQEEPVKVTEDQKGQLPSSTDLPTKVEEPKMEEKEFTKASSEAKEATATADDAAKEEPSTTAVLQPSLPGNNVSVSHEIQCLENTLL